MKMRCPICRGDMLVQPQYPKARDLVLCLLCGSRMEFEKLERAAINEFSLRSSDGSPVDGN